MWHRLGGKTKVATGVVLLIALVVVGANARYHLGFWPSPNYCTSCHQIQGSYDRWSRSAHRGMSCADCHGSTLAIDLGLQATNLRHVYYQVSGRIPSRVRLKDAQVDRVAANCARCHQDKFSQWRAGGHSVAYSHIFLSKTHNAKTLLMDDCLRCHGMFADGNVTDVVTPIDTRGPWTLVRASLSSRPAIPCLTCHEVHGPGTPVKSPNYLEPKSISYGRAARNWSLGFYDRRERRHIPADDLPLPTMRLNGRAVVVSADRRQTLCYQCHSPEAFHEVGSGDDRTAVGVHEGIGCLGCHDAHTLDARASCANCHPSQSNCGLDVATMDTTFKSGTSAHNIHFVACADCHTKGVPKSRRQQRPRESPRLTFAPSRP